MGKNYKIIGGAIAAVVIIGGVVLIRGLQQDKKADAETTNKVTILQVAHTQNYKPYDYVNEAGESDGFEVQVLKAVDKKLKNYKFEYNPTSDEDLLVGLESGKYDIGTKGAWKTAEREEKFIIPEEKIAASVIGLTFRKADAAKYTSLEAFAKAGGRLVPISPQNAQYQVIEEFNQKNPATPINLAASEQFTISDAYAWVLENRYDGFFDIKLSFDNSVLAEAGPYHQYVNDLSYIPYKGIPTYPIIHKDEANEEFAKAYDQAVKELAEDGTLKKLSIKYFGEDVFSYIQE
ncbi:MULTISPECIES: transporter substrate-binding domain-containing protein [unclassified Enterococcus]|uniref:transporter substrate-binding domain-containing protein n=1 Tax=unclassified Enterococcus TaxID=2608891 RepID=UPI00155706AC|nr:MULTISPECIES: transporter substrate-binding domain-containing protein [unclassified Enterococcus]MBS7577338.1 transporter substrate-binding domain-containing protein [Enterococcus sp. MMGLQ5-2]MBS7584745.1 transporter substrate-binding domain-containing protein [Enterococcus sp. MMGLQ5-1]NPD12600.1 transporter substrate-binding domain-containing protein [Enterococcus sp. MMGLQ5-1]NPD37172.1 transporter substrate-binding domain-containing protein [Enterococcus sp. MMGLQ5-2]